LRILKKYINKGGVLLTPQVCKAKSKGHMGADEDKTIHMQFEEEHFEKVEAEND